MHQNNLHPFKITWALLLLMILVACQKPQAILEIHPAAGCIDSPTIPLQVTWDIRPLGLEASSIEVNSLGYPAKLWIREGAAGSKQTGAWADDGFTVTLRTMDGELLARRTFVHQVCETQQ